MVKIESLSGEILYYAVEHGKPGWNNLDGLCLIEAALREADLFGVRLNASDLTGSDLVKANFGATELRDAKLRNANLRSARFSYANLYFASLSGSDLCHAEFSNIELKGTSLTYTTLKETTFVNVDFTDAEFSGAVLDHTRFIFCDNLHKAEGLAYVKHDSPSALDRHTLRTSIHCLPDVFLNGVGYSNNEIQVLRDLYQPDKV